MKKLFFSAAVLFSISFSSCDKIDSPYGDPQSGGNTSGDTVVQKILLEDYTGFYCTNCPNAHRVAAQLKTLYGEQLIVMGVHAGFFATPGVFGPLYTYDFRTPAGSDLYTFFLNNNEPLPTGMVNRQAYNGSLSLVSGKWGPAITALISQTPKASLLITAKNYNASTGLISATVKTTALSAINEGLRLCLYVTEDSIVKPQLDNGVDVPDYIHRHVLRGSLNSTFGDAVTAGFAVGDTSSLTISGSLPQPDINPVHLYLVALLIRENGRDIVQVEEQKLLP